MPRAYRLGIFIVGALIILAIGIFLIGNQQFLFSSTYRLNADFTTVAGLDNGAEVRVGGIHQGTVRQIQLPTKPGENVKVVMDLQDSTRFIIKKDSVASIQTEGLLGSKFVAISFGSKDAPSVKNGDTIASTPPIDFPDLIKKTNLILDSTMQTMNNAAETTDRLKSMSEKIDEGKGTIGGLINDRSAYEQLNAATAQAKAGATAFQEDMEALKHNWFLRGFFNRRGYEDSAELTKYEIAQLPEGSYIKKFVYNPKKLFNEDSAKLKDGKALNEAGRFLEENQFGLAVVVANSGMKGDSEKDLVLTQGQALSVREYLVKNFRMDDTRLKTIGLGKKTQMGGVDTGTVAIYVYPVGSTVPPSKNLAGSKPRSASRKDLSTSAAPAGKAIKGSG